MMTCLWPSGPGGDALTGRCGYPGKPGAIDFEDTAHYRRRDDAYAQWISFLDLKLTWCKKTKDILSQLIWVWV